MQYKPQGVCSQLIQFDIENNKVRNVGFVGGCNGNLQGISRLIEGMDVDEAISGLKESTAATSPHPARISLQEH